MPRLPAPAAGPPLAIEKQACRAAYQGARAVDATRGAMFDRLYVETIQATARRPRLPKKCGGNREFCFRSGRTTCGDGQATDPCGDCGRAQRAGTRVRAPTDCDH